MRFPCLTKAHSLGWLFVLILQLHAAQARLNLRSILRGSLLGRSETSPYSADQVFRFVTRPDIEPPKWKIEKKGEGALAPGYWFIAPYAKLEQIEYPLWNGPHIYTGEGELIWSGAPMFEHRNTFDFRVITYEGRDSLSLLDPADEHKGGVILDSSYNIQHTVDLRGPDLNATNMHDFMVVDNGERALTLTKVPGRSTLEESSKIGFEGECKAGWEGFKELDTATSDPVFEWSAHGHISLDESTKIVDTYHNMCTNGWDILHLNSIDKFPDGDYLLSSRHTDTIYKVSHEDGAIVWRLGGDSSDFELAPGTHFSRQHDARMYSQNQTHTLITVFDNAMGDGLGEQKTNDRSRGLLLSLRTDIMKAEMLVHFDHPHGRITNSRGGVQYLSNGNALVGFTYGSLMAEYTKDGKLLMQAHAALGAANTYRAYKYPWVGHPSNPPDVVSIMEDTDNGKQSTVYVSWNGATEVDSWKVYETHAQGEGRNVSASGSWQGFESKFTFDGFPPFVVVEALDSGGNVLGTSNITETVPDSETGIPIYQPIALFTISALLCISAFFIVRQIRARRRRKDGWIASNQQEFGLLAHEDEDEDDEVDEVELPEFEKVMDDEPRKGIR